MLRGGTIAIAPERSVVSVRNLSNWAHIMKVKGRLRKVNELEAPRIKKTPRRSTPRGRGARRMAEDAKGQIVVRMGDEAIRCGKRGNWYAVDGVIGMRYTR